MFEFGFYKDFKVKFIGLMTVVKSPLMTVRINIQITALV